MSDPGEETSVNGDCFERRRGGIGRFAFWLKRQLIQDVPAADARCEFGCKRLECRHEEWATCQRRIEEAKK